MQTRYYQKLAIQRWIKRLTQLSVLLGPDVGRDLFSVTQDGALSGGEPVSGTPEGVKPREQAAPLGDHSPVGGVLQGGVLEHPEQPMSPGCEYVAL